MAPAGGINTVSNPYLSGSAIDNGPVSLSDLPLLNVIDLTKRSANAAKIRSGQVNHPQDLESEMQEDANLSTTDLSEVEIEVNKKKKKKEKAEQANEMISPASSVRSSVRVQPNW